MTKKTKGLPPTPSRVGAVKQPAVKPLVGKQPAGSQSVMKQPRAKQPRSQTSPEEQEIKAWVSSVRFKRQVVGGLDEKDVWKKIGELDALYAKALAAERLRCDTMVAHWRKVAERSQAKSVEAQIRASKAGSSNPRTRQQGGECDG